MKTIYELRDVNDLADGEQAFPESQITYELRTFDNKRVESGTVEYVVRDGERLYAKMTTGYSFRVNGAGSHVLVPKGL